MLGQEIIFHPKLKNVNHMELQQTTTKAEMEVCFQIEM
jgi:hypothetical protein